MYSLNIRSRYKTTSLIVWLCALFSCGVNAVELTKSTTWDFDHHLRYSLTEVSTGKYLLEVETQINLPRTNTKQSKNSKGTAFERGSAFLIRKSLAICKGYHYSLEILDGVEGVNDKQDRPNLQFGALKAKLACATNK